jgi:hypothetical protein
MANFADIDHFDVSVVVRIDIFFALFKKVFDFFCIYVKVNNFPLYPKSFGSFALHAAVAQG